MQTQASVQLASGVPYMSDAQLQTALTEAGVPPDITAAALDVNKDARVAGLRAALALLAVIAMLGLFSARRIPRDPVRGSPQPDAAQTTLEQDPGAPRDSNAHMREGLPGKPRGT